MKECHASRKTMPMGLMNIDKGLRLISVVSVLIMVLLGAGCMSRFQTATYEAVTRPSSALARTNFRVDSVSVSNQIADERKIMQALQTLERTQNQSLIPLPYSVRIHHEWENNSASDGIQILSLVSLLVLPNWEGHSDIFDIQTEIAASRDGLSTKGKEKDLTVYSWLMLPTGVIGMLLLQDSYDSRSGTLEERLAKAAFSTLTEARYKAGIKAMRVAAARRLVNGQELSEIDERLLQGQALPSRLLVSRAKHPGNPVQSREALRGISNGEDLADIALHAAIPKIREEAAAKISGFPEERYAELVTQTTYFSVAQIFLKNISSPKLLYLIVENASASEDIRLAALAKISSERVLAHIAKSAKGPEVLQRTALERIQDETALADIAQHAAIPSIRLEVIRRIANHEVLKQVVENDPDVQVRFAAFRKISNPSDLNWIALHNSEQAIRLEALARISNQEVLETIAREDTSLEVRLAAVKKLEHAATLELIAQQDSNPDVRKVAIEKVVDQTVLATVATSDKASINRKAAVKKLNDASLLVQIAQNDAEPEVRREAVTKIDAPEVLINVARHDSVADVRLVAVEGLSNQDVLLDIYDKEQDPRVKTAAMKKLSAESKRRLLAPILQRASQRAISLSGFYLGMDESDAQLLFDSLLPDSSMASCVTIKNNKVTGFRFSVRELQRLLGNNKALSIDMIPEILNEKMGCSLRYEPEEVEILGWLLAVIQLYRFSSLDGETLLFYGSDWKEYGENVINIVRSAEMENRDNWDNPLAEELYRAGVVAGIEKRFNTKKAEFSAPVGTLIWELK